MKRILLKQNTKVKTAKLIFVLMLLCTITSSFAAVKTTVTNGNWFNPNDWSPVGVPLIEDTVIVNHQMTAMGDVVEFGANWLIVTSNGSILCDSIFALHGSLRLYGNMNVNRYADGDGDSTLIYGELIGLDISPSNPVAFNYGTVSADTLVIGETFHNHGSIVTYFITAGGGSAPFINYSSASVIAYNSVIFATEVINELNAVMVLGDLMTDVLITNNGEITCASWSHFGGIANGSGSYCVQLCFQNYADIEGALDICDDSPDQFCDWDFGNIASTVTSCTASPCSNNLGLDESSNEILLYPNPAISFITLKNVVYGSQWTILDFSGKKIKTGFITSDIELIDISEFPTGVYMIQIQNQNDRCVNRFEKVD